MEKWQRDHIQKNIRKLVDYTSASCDINFLLAFQEKELLSSEDVTSIKIIPNPYDKCWTFYELIQRKVESYEPLKATLKEFKLTGSLAILNQINAQNASSPFKNLGTISYNKDKMLGRGSYNTKVYQGQFDDRDVAVKLLSVGDIDGTEKELALKEINILKDMDWHANVVRYFKAEIRDDFILIAIELCTTNLREWVATGANAVWKAEVEILKQITHGLAHLHYNKIVHRDLKPENILISCQDGHIIQAKISDFGLSRKLQCGQSKVTVDTAAVGTEGWMAPEVIYHLDKNTDIGAKFQAGPPADIFSLGCIFYFVLTGGSHPFGSSARRQANILDGKFDMGMESMKALEAFKAESFIWLINQMIKHIEKERPSAEMVLIHPSFWETRRIIIFFEDIYPYIDTYYEVLENPAGLRNGNTDWISLLDNPIQQLLKTNKRISWTNGAHLLKVIVEMKRGYHNLPYNVKEVVSDEHKEYVAYWGNLFPFFLPLLWVIFQYPENPPESLKSYYHANSKFKFGFVDYLRLDLGIDTLYIPLTQNTEALLIISKEANNISFVETGLQDIAVNPEVKTQMHEGNLNMLPVLPKNYLSRLLLNKNGWMLTEETLISQANSDFSKRVMVIRGNIGMGKTAFLAQLGTNILRASPERKLFYFEMKNVLSKLRELSGGTSVPKSLIFEALQHLTGESMFGKDNWKVSIEIIIDDVNDVENQDWNLVIHILKSISSLPHSIRMWIAMVPKVMKEIELILNCHSYRIEPLREEKQVELMASYWEMQTSQNKQKLLDLAKECVRSFKMDRNYELGNPLQCLLIGAACLRKENFDSNYALLLPPQNIQHIDYIQENFLLDAATWRSLSTLELVLGLKKFNINCLNSQENPPLFLSVLEKNNVDCLLKFKLLVEHGADLNFNKKDNSNLLHFAAINSSYESLNYILNLNKFDINCTDNNLWTSILYCLFSPNQSDCLEKLKLLINWGANVSPSTKTNRNLLMTAAQYSTSSVLEYVLNMEKFDIEDKNNEGDTSVLLSVMQYENIDCLAKLKMLKDLGANLDHVNKYGENLLHIAAQYGSLEVLKYVISLNRFDINCKDQLGRTALDRAKITDSIWNIKNVDMEKKVKLLSKIEKRFRHSDKQSKRNTVFKFLFKK